MRGFFLSKVFPISQIKPKTVTASKMEAVDDVIRWRWKSIDVKIDELLGLTKRRK